MQVIGERLARDVFPAEVLLPDGSMIRGCRVFVTSHRALVFTSHGREVSLAVELPLAEPGSVVATRSTLQGGRLEISTPDGTAWVNQGRGCGCSSPLHPERLEPIVPWGGR